MLKMRGHFSTGKRILLAALFIALAVAATGFNPSVRIQKIQGVVGAPDLPTPSERFDFPLEIAFPKKIGPVILSFSLVPGWFFPSDLGLSTESCIFRVVLNGRSLWESGMGGAWCTSGVGPPLQFPWRRFEKNTVEITFLSRAIDKPGTVFSRVFAEFPLWRRALAGLAAIAAIVCLLSALPAWATLSPGQRAGLVGSLPLYLFAFEVTPTHLRSYDFHGHLAYLSQVWSGVFWPNPAACWECHQPPLYYWLGALFVRATGASAALKDLRLPLLSLFFYSLFSVYSLALIHRFVRSASARFWVSALFLLWPSAFFHATRVSNDILLYALTAASLYQFWIWQDQSEGRGPTSWPWRACGLAALGVMTKLNALLLFVYFLFSLGRRRDPRPRSIRAAALILLLALGSLAGLRIFRMAQERQPLPAPILTHREVGLSPSLGGQNVQGAAIENSKWLDNSLKVKNGAAAFLKFSPWNFIHFPFADPVEDEKGRQDFWVYLAKTMLWGDCSQYPPALIPLARTVNVFFLLLVLSSLVGLLRGGGIEISARHSLLTLGGLYIVALVGYRLWSPYSCNGDFRHIYPVLPALLGLAAAGQAKTGQTVWRIAVLGLGASSVWFVGWMAWAF